MPEEKKKKSKEKKTGAGGKKRGRAQTASRRKGQKQQAGRNKAPEFKALRRKAEAALKKQTARLDELSRQDIKQLVQELGTYQIELEMQNEELRRSQMELEKSRSRYGDLYEFAPISYFTVDLKGVIDTVNLTGTSLLGISRKDVLRKPFATFVHNKDKDKFYHCLRAAIEQASRQTCVLRLKVKDSAVLHAHLEIAVFMDEAQDIDEIRITVSNINDLVEAQSKLQHNHSLLQAIIDNTDVMLASVDREFNFIWVNESYAESCRMKPQELVGKNHFTLFPHAENEAIFRQVRDTGKLVFFKDKSFTFADQPERGVTYWDWSLVPVTDSAGEVGSLVLSLRETTPFKKMELALAESEARYRTITETSIDIIFQLDLQARITYVSPSARTLGYSLEDVQDRSIAEFIHEEDWPRTEAALKKLFKGRKIKLFDLRLVSAEGAIVEFEINANPMVWLGLVVGIQGVARDVSERRRAEELIRRSQAQLDTILQNLSEGVIVSDLEGKLIYWNPAAAKLHGFSAEEEYLRSLPDFQENFELFSPETGILPLEMWPMTRILRGETLQNTEITVRRRDMEWEHIFNYSGTLARNEKDSPMLGILTVSDVTERRQAEDRVRFRNAILDGINHIFQIGMTCVIEEELAGETLRIAADITGSRFGFIGEIGPDGLLHDLAISNFAWEQCDMPDQTGHRRPPGDFRIAGLYGKVLTDGKALLTNNPSDHPASAGTPPGHPQLHTFIGVPLLSGEKTIGLIAIANRDGGYHQEHLESLELLAPAFVEILFKCRAERALQESEIRERNKTSQLQQLLDFTPIPVWIAHDPDCRKITGNYAASVLLGVQPGKNVSLTSDPGKTKTTIKHFRRGKELQPEELPLQQAVKSGKEINDAEIEMVLSGGKFIYLQGAAIPLEDAAGKIVGAIAAYIDITERKKFEDALVKAKQDWEQTFDSVPDLVAILDNEYKILRVNRAMAQRVGLPPEKIIGRKCYSCFCGIAEPLESCPHTLTLNDGRGHKKEFREKMLGGYFQVTTTPLLGEQGNLKRSIYVARDITEEKKTEQTIIDLNRELRTSLLQLEEANKNLVRSNKDLLHFASIVSHDLQEPLRTVASFTQLLKRRYEPKLDRKAHLFMEHIVGGTTHMQRLLNDLLAFSRVGGGDLLPKPVALEEILRDIIRKMDRRIRENRAEITYDTLPVVHGDDMQLFTLLQNLFSNALKYRGKASPKIHVSARQGENEWTIRVKDNGIGIDPKHADHIFLIFQRLHLRDEYEGTGIGLAICKRIVERHGGRIWVESEPGRGASFFFTLPLRQEDNIE